MGCTSSAPNVIEAHTNSTDRTIHFLEDESINKNKENELNKENGLSKCDNVNDVHLDRNNLYIHNGSTTTENIEDDQSKQEDNNQMNQNDTDYREQEKITTLKEVVEHVLSNNVLEKHENIENSSSESNLTQVEAIEHETDTQVERSKDETSSVTAPEEIKEVVEELASPSQSEGSRATRWEALADMAAELPPSLTVDPITGQIYALSK
ncbi:PREDICTED: uncharacterized protein LOC106121275 [Papilio xuthus]|uniref:Uncharacterized protein LOC106121275 n=1 Tax=Papilio xuthus TaxID=66420 RepID=A0A194PX91_PAPXU|nr:PREDICTED: uncharacterized protein LOC106121275 [Papilio xuthus]KPI97379.1 hypothetical protein RR46_09286 [Papilio xuthus]